MIDSPFRKYIKENEPTEVKFKWGPEEYKYVQTSCKVNCYPESETRRKIRKKLTKELYKRRNALEKGLLFGDWEEYQKYIGSEKQMGEKEMWSMYDVIMIDKDKLETVIDTSVIAKTSMHAKGKAGVYDKLEEAEYDESKFVINVVHIAGIRPVEDEDE